MAVSIGGAHYPSHADTAEGLLQKAGIAMHQAASRKVILARYDDRNDRTSRDNLLLLGRLPQAIERGELEVWHQAKFSLVTGEVTETEALVRWRHPERGIVPPDSFIPQVEETLLINPVTQAVITKAFADAKAWREAGHRMSVAINLSVRNLLDDTLLTTLEEQAALNGLTPQDIGLEITESAIMVEPQHCTRLVSALRECGYGIAIDDFGTGHASLAYLQKLRVSALKIDQAFVRTLARDADNRKIVQAILNLAMSLGISTVAEGVEDVESFSLLRDWGCDYAQGYYLHRPAPAGELARFLDERHARLRAMRRAEV
jgi:EAL domain-containing protein (putative c-di-GMP-specific phosphodiesterase class I)